MIKEEELIVSESGSLPVMFKDIQSLHQSSLQVAELKGFLSQWGIIFQAFKIIFLT